MKRKKPDAVTSAHESSTPKKRRIPTQVNGHFEPDIIDSTTPEKLNVSIKKGRAMLLGSKKIHTATVGLGEGSDDTEPGSPTPKANGTTLFVTPRKEDRTLNGTPGKRKKADRSAKRKSARALLENEDEEDWDGEAALARDILGDEDEGEENENNHTNQQGSPAADTGDEVPSAAPETPSKRRGRPKGSKNRRSPTPEGDLPPEERFFFQNRSGPPQVSNNTLASLKLPTHEEYFELMRKYRDHHDPEKAYLMKLHARSFPQWQFELAEGFNVCLYGWGSKRHLVNKFAEWMSIKSRPAPRIIIINGYTPKLNMRNVLATVASEITEADPPLRLIGSPQEMLDTILTKLSSVPSPSPIIIMVNSIDAPFLRRRTTQSILARLSAHPSIHLIATADSPGMALLWSSSLKMQFNFVFHDCTTYAPFDVEFSVIDDVHELLGRKGRRIGGKEGIGFVLKSLPENARNLYRVLLTELLAVLTDGIDGPWQEELDEEEGGAAKRSSKENEGEVGIEYRSLYQKASEEFICSSDMNFRFLLKEFHDHQMITSSRDASGTELLGVPLAKEEIEGVLEDLVVG